MKKIILTFTLLTCLNYLYSCGKNNSSGAPSNSQNTLTPAPYSGIVQSQDVDAFSNFKSWFLSANEPSLLNGTYRETRIKTTYSVTDGCEDKPINIFGLNLGNYEYCVSKSNMVSNDSIEEMISIDSSYQKSHNTKLAEAFTGSQMTLVNATAYDVSYDRQIYYLEYVKPNNHRKIFKIDTGYHSAFNPVEITDTENLIKERISIIEKM